MKNIKKVVLAFALSVLSSGVFAQYIKDPAVFDGNMTVDKVISRIKNNELLPLRLNDYDSFQNSAEKERVIKVAGAQVTRYNDYTAHYNAAIVYATSGEFVGDVQIPLSATNAANALRHATKAIELQPKSVYMYLLRGEVYARQGVGWDPHVSTYIISHDYAKKALADFEKVAELNPALAPYLSMAGIAQALGQKAKADKYSELDEKFAQQAKSAAQRQKEENAKKIVKAIFGTNAERSASAK